MDDQTFINLDKAVISVQSALTFVVGVMGWWAKNQNKRIQELEKEMRQKVDLEQYNNALESLRKEIRETARENVNAIIVATKQITEATERMNMRIDNLLTAKEAK